MDKIFCCSTILHSFAIFSPWILLGSNKTSLTSKHIVCTCPKLGIWSLACSGLSFQTISDKMIKYCVHRFILFYPCNFWRKFGDIVMDPSVCLLVNLVSGTPRSLFNSGLLCIVLLLTMCRFAIRLYVKGCQLLSVELDSSTILSGQEHPWAISLSTYIHYLWGLGGWWQSIYQLPTKLALFFSHVYLCKIVSCVPVLNCLSCPKWFPMAI